MILSGSPDTNRTGNSKPTLKSRKVPRKYSHRKVWPFLPVVRLDISLFNR